MYLFLLVQFLAIFLPVMMKGKLKQGECKAARTGNMLAVSWTGENYVRFLSSYSAVAARRRRETKVVPKVGGVDLSDQLTHNYADERKTIKYWKKVVFHFLDRTATNA